MMLGKDYMLAIVIVNYEGRCVCRTQPHGCSASVRRLVRLLWRLKFVAAKRAGGV